MPAALTKPLCRLRWCANTRTSRKAGAPPLTNQVTQFPGVTSTKVQLLTPGRLAPPCREPDDAEYDTEGGVTSGANSSSRYLLYLLYYYKSTNTDASSSFSSSRAMSLFVSTLRGSVPLQVLSLLALLVQKDKY